MVINHPEPMEMGLPNISYSDLVYLRNVVLTGFYRFSYKIKRMR